MHAAFDLQLEVGNAADDDAVGGDILRADVHAQLQPHVDASFAADGLVHAGDLPGRDLQILRDHFAFRHDRLDRLVADLLELHAQAVADHEQRLAQSHVLDLAGADGGAELVDGHSRADLALQRLAARRGVLDADDVD